MWIHACGLPHSILATVPSSRIGLFTSNSAENAGCAKAGITDRNRTVAATLAASVAATVLFLSVMPAFAHPAFSAEFDVNKPIRLEGTVAKMEWGNPHAWIHIYVKKPDGPIERDPKS